MGASLEEQDIGEPWEKKKKVVQINVSDQEMTLGSHWPKCAFQAPDRSSNVYCQNI